MKILVRTIVLIHTLSLLAFCQDLPPINITYASEVLCHDGRILGYIGEKSRVDVRSTGYVSKWVLYSLISTEDRDFYNHNGVSYKGLIRGILKTITSSTQGGSTLTMQLARNLFLTNERTISRKITEIDLAKKLEAKYSKDQILLMYLNTVYFGRGVYGIWAAAQEYYAKTPDKLSVTEAAAIVGLLKNPTGYDPSVHPEKMLSRRNEVLHNLVEVGHINEKEFQKYKKTPLNLKLNEHVGRHFIEQVRKEAVEILKPFGKSLNSDEIKITTTCDYYVQKAAVEAIKTQWENFPASMKKAQVGLISVENWSGRVKAMVGGNPESDFRGLNRAVQIKRQPGSSFKPFLYGYLLKNGYTLATPLLDSAIVVDSGKVNEWRPSNSDNTSTGMYLPMETAVQHSINLCAADAITRLTRPDSIAAFAHQLGIASVIPPYPSIALGSADVSPEEMAAAFSVFATEGTWAQPYTIIKIEDKNGRVYYNGNQQSAVVLDSATCYLMTKAMQTVVDSGTASSIRRFYRGFAAGKTGTSSDYTDAWFVGFNRWLTTAIWIGNDNPHYKLSGGYQYGGTACAPIWGRMMGSMGRAKKGEELPLPSNVKAIELCAESGLPALPECPRKRLYPVNIELVKDSCNIHARILPPRQ